MTPSSQTLGSPAIPGRFTTLLCQTCFIQSTESSNHKGFPPPSRPTAGSNCQTREGLDIHLILENYQSHNTPLIRKLAGQAAPNPSPRHPDLRLLAQSRGALDRRLDRNPDQTKRRPPLANSSKPSGALLLSQTTIPNPSSEPRLQTSSSIAFVAFVHDLPTQHTISLLKIQASRRGERVRAGCASPAVGQAGAG